MGEPSLSKSLRTTGGLYLFYRRGIVITRLVAGASMMMIGLYQMGILGELPDLRRWRPKGA